MVPNVKKVLSCSLLALGIFSKAHLHAHAISTQKTDALPLTQVNDAFPELTVGVLKFGTINWEMDVIKHHKLDKQAGYTLNVLPLASKNAAAVALLSGTVDVIMTDAFWVAKQQSMAKDYVLYPTTKLTGGIYSKATQPSLSLSTWLTTTPLLGIAGGKHDKTWLITQAYFQALNLPTKDLSLQFAAPPLLNRIMKKEPNAGVINFWHYTARLKTQGFKPVISTQEMLDTLGIKGELPLLGWAFHQDFASENSFLITQFLLNSHTAKNHLQTSELEWLRIKNLTRAEDSYVFQQLQQDYPNTLLSNFTEIELQTFINTYPIFAKTMRLQSSTPRNIFWSKAQDIWQKTKDDR